MAKSAMNPRDSEEYRNLLEEIFNRGLEPESTLNR